MPTYQYRCTDCGEPLEVVQSFTDDPLTVCPSCSGTLRKVFSSVGVVFKGSGFYRTDSRAETKSATKTDAKAETKSESKSESKTDTRTDTKTDTKSGSGSDKPAAKSDSSTTSSSAA